MVRQTNKNRNKMNKKLSKQTDIIKVYVTKKEYKSLLTQRNKDIGLTK